MTLHIESVNSPNYEPRKDGKTARYLILHYTGCDAAMACARFMNGSPDQPDGGRLSTHYMVHENGQITQFVHEQMRAWHAGVSYWRGETDLNSSSIGIEIENLGECGGYPPFAPRQIESVIELARDILRRHPAITPLNVLGHSDIAPGRKLDPGPAFPWSRLARAGIGVLSPDFSEIATPTNLDVEAALTQIGYNPALPLEMRLEAFCRHYLPGEPSPADPRAVLTGLDFLIQMAKKLAF